MAPDEGTDTVMADFTGPTTDEGGGQYEQYVSADAPTHDPFADYPPSVEGLVARLPVPMQVSYTLAHNLDVRRQKVWACWGHDVQVGWIGDASHQGECSDHNPDSTGVVHAIDVMATGARAAATVRETLAHPGDLQYVIHNRVIWSASASWAPRAYTGSNPHTDHVHISGKHGGAHSTGHTCTGYDLTAQASTPTFNPCPTPKPPGPRPPVPPPLHAPGTRNLSVTTPVMRGADVVFVQTFIGPAKCGAADGAYGPHTADGVRWYQRMRGIQVDGQVGPQTWGQMGVRWAG